MISPRLTYQVVGCLFLLSGFALAAPDLFPMAVNDAKKRVEKQAKEEKDARSQARKEFIFGMREGGSTYGLNQLPLQIKEAPAIDAKVMADAKASLRKALPEGTLSESDQIRIEIAEFELEELGGNYASRSAALTKLTARTQNADAVRAVMDAFKRRKANTEILSFAEAVLSANKNNTAMTALALGWRWHAAKALKEKALAEETKRLVDALPITDENVNNAYMTFLWGGNNNEHDFDHLLANLEKTRHGGIKTHLFREILRGRVQAEDLAGMMQWLPRVEALGSTEANWGRTVCFDALMRMRCFKTARPLAEKLFEAAPASADAALRLARVLLGCGLRAEAAAPAAVIYSDEKAKPELRFVGRVIEAVAKAPTPEAAATAVLALEPVSNAKDGEEFALFVNEGAWQVFEPLMTDENAKWLIALRTAFMSLMHEEERLVYTVRYCESAPRTAAGADAVGLFDPGLFSSAKPENRFAPYQTYAWSQRRALLGNLKCKPKPDLVGVKGEGRAAELVAVYDETGVHVYTRFRDPSAAKFKLGEAEGCGYEFTFMPGTETGWHQIFTQTDAVNDLNEVEWDSLDFGRRLTSGTVVTDSTTTDDAFLFHTFIPWSMVYTRIPSDGDTWQVVMCASMPAGTFTLGGGAVHELGRGMKMKFKLSADESRIIRRAIVRRAAGDFLRFRAPWENVEMWGDSILGDPEFFDTVVKPWAAEHEQAARGLVKRADADVSDAEYDALAARHLSAWYDPRLTLDAMRSEWLENRYFTE